jgi:hypothetical protein
MPTRSLDTFNQRQAQLVTGLRLPVATLKGPQPATVVSSTSTTVTVTLDLNGWEHVPFTAPYQEVPGASPATPPAGSTCLIVFVGNGLDKPYCVMFTGGWP